MLNHQLLRYDVNGRILATIDEPDYFNGGTPTKDGLLCIAEVDGDVFVNGLGYVHERNVCAEQAVNPPSGNPFASPTGRAPMSSGVPAFWLYGLPFTTEGALAIVLDGPPPVEEFAFDDSFDNSFDIE
jgi:hypothetical protein